MLKARLQKDGFPYPYVVKPLRLGSSFGVSLVRNKNKLIPAIKEAFKYDKRIIIEEYIDGQEIIRRLRTWSELPIIVLSARNRESDITQALDNGADDYLTKPFSTIELLSRINALLRRVAKLPGGGAQECFQADDLKIELTRRRVFVGEREVQENLN